MKRLIILCFTLFCVLSANAQKRKYSKDELKEIVRAQQNEITQLKLENEILLKSAARFNAVEQLMFSYRSEGDRLRDTINVKVREIGIKKQENSFLLESIRNYKKEIDQLILLSTSQKKSSNYNLQTSKTEQLKLSNSSEYNYRSERKHYITGPRGGCYYINGNGNKTYVDRSLCR